MNNIYNKKAITSGVLVTVIISLLGFFIAASVLVDFGDNLVSNSDDLICKQYVRASNTDTFEIAKFFKDINIKCKKDFYSKEVENKEEAYDLISESMMRCWKRYDEGQSDFLGKYNVEGAWCFECAEIDFEDSSDEVGYDSIEYLEYVKFLKTKTTNVNSSPVSYFDYMNLKYSNSAVDDNGVYQTKIDIDEIINSGEPYLQDIGELLNTQYNYALDLRKKEINFNEKNYIVYRYDKPDNYSVELDDMMYGIGAGVAGSLGTSFVLGEALKWGITGLVCVSSLVFPPSAVVCGGMVTYSASSGVVKGVKTAYKTASKITTIGKKIKKVADVLSTMTKFSKTTNRVNSLVKSMNDFRDLDRVINVLEKGKDVKKNARIIKTLKLMKDFSQKKGLKNFDSIEGYIDKMNIDTLTKGDAIFFRDILKNNVDLLSKKGISNSLNNGEIKDVVNFLTDFSDNAEKVKNAGKSAKTFKKVKRVLKYGIPTVVGAAAGGALVYNYNGYSNQYVDILNEEQYYRLCGTKEYKK